MKRSFVSFYDEHGVSPIRQDISDLKAHYSRRRNLLSSIGLIPVFLEGKAIIEFGPGSGHNTVYLASLNPRRLDLVEGNSKGINDSKSVLTPFLKQDIRFHHCFFEDFKISDKFDLVWAEGCVPHQANPLSIAKHISSYTKPGGIVVFTFASGISYLSEVMRRIFNYKCFRNSKYSLNEKLNIIKPYMSNHLKNLRNMSRYYDDWIIDNLLQPLNLTRLFTIPDAINLLKSTHNILLTSPKFVQDWRWYKDIANENSEINEITLDSYYKSNLNLLDYRYSGFIHSYEFGIELEKIGLECWDLMCKIESGEDSMLDVFYEKIRALLKMIKSYSPETVKSLEASLKAIIKPELNIYDNEFASWWGRGQQYASFIRK